MVVCVFRRNAVILVPIWSNMHEKGFRIVIRISGLGAAIVYYRSKPSDGACILIFLFFTVIMEAKKKRAETLKHSRELYLLLDCTSYYLPYLLPYHIIFGLPGVLERLAVLK